MDFSSFEPLDYIKVIVSLFLVVSIHITLIPTWVEAKKKLWFRVPVLLMSTVVALAMFFHYFPVP